MKSFCEGHLDQREHKATTIKRSTSLCTKTNLSQFTALLLRSWLLWDFDPLVLCLPMPTLKDPRKGEQDTQSWVETLAQRCWLAILICSFCFHGNSHAWFVVLNTCRVEENRRCAVLVPFCDQCSAVTHHCQYKCILKVLIYLLMVFNLNKWQPVIQLSFLHAKSIDKAFWISHFLYP